MLVIGKGGKGQTHGANLGEWHFEPGVTTEVPDDIAAAAIERGFAERLTNDESPGRLTNDEPPVRKRERRTFYKT